MGSRPSMMKPLCYTFCSLVCFGKISKLEATEDSGKWLPSGKYGECGIGLDDLSPKFHLSRKKRLILGEETDFAHFPFMVLLGYQRNYSQYNSNFTDGIYYECGGTLINKWYVLTAGHCLQNEKEDLPSEVLLGNHILSDNQKLIRRGVNRDKTIVHSDYTHHGKHNAPGFDIGLIRLDEPVSN